MKLNNILFNTLFKSKSAKIIRNLLNIKKTNLLLDYTKKNVSVSDSFFWRVDKNFSTIFKFNDLLKFFYNDDSSNVILFFFDSNFNLIKQIDINSFKINENLTIDQKFLGLAEGFGSFYIFHNTKKDLKSIIRNSCYTGYTFKGSIPSFVHGNLQGATKNFDSDKIKFGLGANSLFSNNIYVVQNEMKFDKTEIIFVNNCNSNVKFYLDEDKIIMKKGHTKIIDILDRQIISLKSNAYLLRPIIFNYKGEFLDVYHG